MKQNQLIPALLMAVVAFAAMLFAPSGTAQTVAALSLLAIPLLKHVQIPRISLRMGALLATSITISALNSAFGATFHDGSKNAKDLYAQVFEQASFDELFDVEETNLTELRYANTTSTAMLQAFQTAFTPNSSITATPVSIPLQLVKVDLTLYSHDVFNSFIGFLHKEGVAPTAQEYLKYILNQHVIPQVVEDFELHGSYAGVYVAPTPGTAGNVGDMINGFKKIVNDAITATTITPIAAGTVPTDAVDYCTYIETFAAGIANADVNKPMTIAMSLAAEQLFKAGNRAKYSSTYLASNDLTKLFYKQNLMVKGYAAMGDSTKVFCTPKGNLKKGVNKGTGQLFNFEGQDRQAKIFADWAVGYGILRKDRFYTNDKDLS